MTVEASSEKCFLNIQTTKTTTLPKLQCDWERITWKLSQTELTTDPSGMLPRKGFLNISAQQ